MNRSWTFLVLGWAIASSLTGTAQLDVLQVQDTIRVRSHGISVVVDSLWADSVWQWQGPCDGPQRPFRFEMGDTAFCSTTLPCTSIETSDVTALNAPLIAADASPLPSTWSVEARLTADFILSLPRESLSANCYPPLSASQFAGILEAIDAAIFESEKCDAIERACREHCLSRSQRIDALKRIPSEDRRLETLTNTTGSETHWTEAELRGMFQLNFILAQALKRFANR